MAPASNSLLHNPTIGYGIHAQNQRREQIWDQLRKRIRPLFDDHGVYVSPISKTQCTNHRMTAPVAMVLLHGDEQDRELGNRILDISDIKIGRCAFCGDYAMALWHSSSHLIDLPVCERLTMQFKADLQNYAKLDLRHHGYNDNHVTLATSALVLGGELTGQDCAVEQGMANLLNFRDTLLRRGMMHEANDCYFWHSLYSTSLVARFARDEQCRELAEKIEHRLLAEHAAFYHPNLGRKIGPSARDYTGGRLVPFLTLTSLWYVLGDGVHPQGMPTFDQFQSDDQRWPFNWGQPDDHDEIMTLGHIARATANTFNIPPDIAQQFYDRSYPHTISATNETGHFPEGYNTKDDSGKVTFHHLNSLQFPATEHTFYTHMEEDWGMGTGDGRMIGACPNNTWQLSYRKHKPMNRAWEQGSFWCSYTINNKPAVIDTSFAYKLQIPGENHHPAEIKKVHHVHWEDMGRFTGMQHQRTSIMLYRPRPVETFQTTSLALTLCYPLVWRNSVDAIWLGNELVNDWDAQSQNLCNIYVQDGPMFIGFRPLLCKPLDAPYRIRVEKRENWGLIHLISYEGDPIDLHDEAALSQIGNGFVCEVATQDDFNSIEEFVQWFELGRVLDETSFWMRQVRYQRPGLNMGLRYDVRNDHAMYKTLNGRTMPQPQWDCNNIPAPTLPWLTEDVSQWDHFSWAALQAKRPLSESCREPEAYLP